MKTITHNPTDGIYAPVGDYVHGLEVRSPGGCCSSQGRWASIPPGRPGADLTEQLQLIWVEHPGHPGLGRHDRGQHRPSHQLPARRRVRG